MSAPTSAASRERVVILGAAGRDFHDFNVVYRDDPGVEVVAFTATQIPDIDGRTYPAELAGPLYPRRHPDRRRGRARVARGAASASTPSCSPTPTSRTPRSCTSASRASRPVPTSWCPGSRRTTLRSRRPVVAVTAVRTGVGKSQTTRYVARLLQDLGQRVVAMRHPMPYGDLAAQACQRFETFEDLVRHDCTIEEREEYEPHIEDGVVVYAGVDYEQILREAEAEADVILWDGGNNDLPFYAPDLHLVLADPLRPGDEAGYHPGEANVRMADVVVVAKCDSARPEDIEAVEASVRALNPRAEVLRCDSPVTLDDPAVVTGRRVVVIEDGPTLTHGSMSFGAGVVGARAAGAAEIVDPEAVRRGVARRRPTRSTRTRAASCRRWATARRRPATSRPPSARWSTPVSSTPSCRARRSTSPGCSRSTCRSSGPATSCASRSPAGSATPSARPGR